MRKPTMIYSGICIATGLGLLTLFTFREISLLETVWPGVLLFSVLGVIAESQSLAIDDNKAISIAFAIDFCALLLFGMAGAAFVSFATAFFSVMDFERGYKEHLFNTPIYKSLMNASNYIVSILACGFVYTFLGGRFLVDANPQGLELTFLFIAQSIPALLVGLIVYIVVNTLTVMIYFYFQGMSLRVVAREWYRMFKWSAVSMVLIGALGIILAGVQHTLGFVAVILFFAPFTLFRYAYVGLMSIQKGYIDTIKAFSAALEAKDTYTIGHARRVEKYCEIIADEMHLSSNRTKVLKYASLLHDIGKIGISEAILNKKEDLTKEEFAEIEKHPVIAAQMLEGIQFLRKEVQIIRAHHVHYDGSGYPPEAKEEGKLLETQILSVADCFDAMTSDRAYRAAMTYAEAKEEMIRCSGSQFSPEVVRALLKGLEKRSAANKLDPLLSKWTREEVSDQAN